jgi:hypothetical protein
MGGRWSRVTATTLQAWIKSASRRSSTYRSLPTPRDCAGHGTWRARAHLRADPERVRKHLEHDVSVRGAILGPPQRRKPEYVRSIVGARSNRLSRARIQPVLRLGESPEARLFEAGEFFRVRSLPPEGLAWSGQVLKQRGHARRR